MTIQFTSLADFKRRVKALTLLKSEVANNDGVFEDRTEMHIRNLGGEPRREVIKVRSADILMRKADGSTSYLPLASAKSWKFEGDTVTLEHSHFRITYRAEV